MLGAAVPFDQGLKAWFHQLDSSVWLVVYRVRRLLVYFVFVFSEHVSSAQVKGHFPDADVLAFTGNSLNALLTGGWQLLS